MCRQPLPQAAVAAAVAPASVPLVQQQQAAPSSLGVFHRMRNAINSVFAPASADEEPVNPSLLTEDVDSPIVPTLTVTTAPEYNEVSLAETDAFHVRVSLKYEESEALSARKTPLDLVCVLDNSGSMTGGKLQSLKKAMDFVIQSLGPNDRLSVVNFNTNPTVLHGLLKMNAANQNTASARIHALNATGGTDILQGMQQGWSILQRRRTENLASCMFLLTDGQDRDHTEQKLNLAREMKAAGTSLFVFGFGTDHDSQHMDAIATAAEGVFTYIESDSMVTDAFGGTIGAQQGVSLCGIQLSMTACERNVTITQILAGRYTAVVGPDGRVGNVGFVNMFMGESRDIMLQLKLPEVDEAVPDYELVKASAIFRVQGQRGSAGAAVPHDTEPSTCTVHRLDPGNFTTAGRARELGVDTQLNRLQTTAAVTQALQEADNHNFESARATLQRCRTAVQASPSYIHRVPTVVALLEEVDDALRSVENRSEYERGGRAMMAECVSANAYQRSTYTKTGRTPTYQTISSAGMQQKAKASKGSYI